MGNLPCVLRSRNICIAKPTFFRLDLHCVRRADSRTDCTAGRSIPIKTPMIAITTSNSTSVKPGRGTMAAFEPVGAGHANSAVFPIGLCSLEPLEAELLARNRCFPSKSLILQPRPVKVERFRCRKDAPA